MTPSTYDSDQGPRDQIQFDVKLKPSGYQARAWISYYKIPNPKQKIGQLYLAVQRVTGKVYQNVDEAMEALKSYGRIFFEMTGFRAVGTTSYPKFVVIANMLPGEGAPQPAQPQTNLPPLPTQLPPLPETAVSQKTIDWLIANQDIIGKRIPGDRYTKHVGEGMLEELYEKGYLKYVQDYPWIAENARKLLER